MAIGINVAIATVVVAVVVVVVIVAVVIVAVVIAVVVVLHGSNSLSNSIRFGNRAITT
jgi:hypothetical protein